MVLSASAVVGVLVGLLFPGIGQGLAAHRLRGVVWAAGAVVTTLLIAVSVWFLPLTLLLRLACAVDAVRCLRRHTPPENLVSAAIALVIGAVGIGSAQFVIEAFKIPSSSMYPTLVIGDHLYIDKLSLRWRPPSRGEIIVFDQPCAHRVYIKRVIAVAGDTIEVRCSTLYINSKPIEATLVEANAMYSDFDESRNEWYPREISRWHETIDGHPFDTFRSRGPRETGSGDRGDFPQRDRLVAPSCTQNEFFTDRKPGASNQPTGQLVVTKEVADPCEPQVHFVVPAASLFVMGDNRHNANDSRYWGVVPLGNVIGRAIGIYVSDGPAGSWARFGAVK